MEKAKLIPVIIAHLRFMAANEGKAFDEGDTFLALCFRTDEELATIARLCGA